MSIPILFDCDIAPQITSTHYQYIPNEICLHYIEVALEGDIDRKIISVGSGTGEFEYMLQQHFIKNKVITIDPNPTSFRPYPSDQSKCIKPMYPNIKELLDDNTCDIKNNVLLLGWPYYGDATFYDMEAIYHLKPISIVVVYELAGSSGSFAFHSWIRSKEVNGISHCYYSQDRTNPIDYYDGVYPKISYSCQGCYHVQGINHATIMFTKGLAIKCITLISSKCLTIDSKYNTFHSYPYDKIEQLFRADNFNNLQIKCGTIKPDEPRRSIQHIDVPMSSMISLDKYNHRCSLCNNECDQYCKACKMAYYCNRECQKKHWIQHKYKCIQNRL